MSDLRTAMLAAAQASEAVLPDETYFVIVALGRPDAEIVTISNIPDTTLVRELIARAALSEPADVQRHVQGEA